MFPDRFLAAVYWKGRGDRLPQVCSAVDYEKGLTFMEQLQLLQLSWRKKEGLVVGVGGLFKRNFSSRKADS